MWDQEEASACVEGVATGWKDMGLKVAGLNPSASLEFHPEISVHRLLIQLFYARFI